jgi:beta-lactamase superfamily II metal-dependent hydrolase
METLGPPPRVLGGHSPENNHSIVLRLTFGRARILLTGDAEREAESDLLAHRYDLRADVLKVGHHGSRWSSTGPFLDAVAPSVAVISCGRQNVFNHPHGETLARLAARNVRVFRTDRDGAVTVETDGANIRVTPTIRENNTGRAMLSPGPFVFSGVAVFTGPVRTPFRRTRFATTGCAWRTRSVRRG